MLAVTRRIEPKDPFVFEVGQLFRLRSVQRLTPDVRYGAGAGDISERLPILRPLEAAERHRKAPDELTPSRRHHAESPGRFGFFVVVFESDKAAVG